MLADPRGVVHATTGILPTVSVSIPPDQYTNALRAIEVTFPTAPLLTNPNRICIPLPDEPGDQWAWLDKDPVDNAQDTDAIGD
ncbi:hypothetical protein KFU94_45565 [Chloroflexi bacterium TSY]|nr:hypothetical protein [Chloroflexi bacterium TSY]